MDWLAHSARDGFPPQSYLEHVESVANMASENAGSAAQYAKRDAALLRLCAEQSAIFHDLGKLDPLNQEALHKDGKQRSLPVNHVDAGAALLKSANGGADLDAIIVYSHHHGLPNLADEWIREKNSFRDQNCETRQRTDTELEELKAKHAELTGRAVKPAALQPAEGDPCILTRMQLSCLSDADHMDTAMHYGKYPSDRSAPALRAEERLEQLDAYIQTLGGSGERNRLRSDMYWACRDADVTDGIAACDSPVGSGKTTAVMAHLLHQAIKRQARRIFVVLPYTNIITQSVQRYREILTLPGENAADVVAELHHRADFESEDARAFNAQWRAPIVVTTAVAFFETLASNRPAGLRRLHELPGSVIFVDEAHAALPVKLLPLAWRWMQILADEWSCYWVMASGSLVKFWTIEELRERERAVPQIVNDNLRAQLAAYEQQRISFPYESKPLSRAELAVRVNSAPGPRLLIMNTVQSAAVIAEDLRIASGQEQETPLQERRILHISTALCADDRERVLAEVTRRLKTEPSYTDWTLVATSCVEAGVDFSFRSGFREIASLLSLLQAAGRINRGGAESDAAILSFTMQDDPMLTRNPAVKNSADVLKRLFDRGRTISPALSTASIQAELYRGDISTVQALLKAEKKCAFETVASKFRVIENETVLVIADEKLKNKIRYGQCDWREIQRKGVSLYLSKNERLSLPLLAEGLYDWNLGYNDFLGVMVGKLASKRAANEFLLV